MRVLWVFDFLSEQVRRVATLLADRPGISLDVMCRWSEEPPLDSSLMPLTHLHCRNKVDFAARSRIRSQIQSGSYDIVHAYTSKNLASVIGACRGLRQAPKIVGYRGTVNRLRLLDPANWITFWHPRVAKILCVCRATENALAASGIPPSKLATVLEGCAPDSLCTPPRSARSEFDIPEDAFVVGLVANMRPVKRIDLLLEAAIQLEHLRNVYWLLVGPVNDGRIETLAADRRIADRVRLTGARPGAGRLAGLFDVYASPSQMEGLSMSVMEAMAQRVCPLVSNAGGLPELVEHEVSGLVVPTENTEAIAHSICRLHDNAAFRQQLADAAYERAISEFSIEAWTERLAQVYAIVCADGMQGRHRAA
ncbi:MAG TPA: glycosyltransferase family 4 protein [Pirellulaceae bacterium]|nr:glycosyltransferase family 4 protein [Pirellulaceae bacterium]